jgi:glycosyltransferase involved in cell wall biosynthesis
MYQGHSVGVVVPAYNERELIGETLTSIPIYVDQIYAVDDGSTDGTCAVIERRQGIDQRIVCLRHERNKGVGAAIITGYQEAIAQGMDIIAVMAGDNQMDPDELPRLLGPIVEGMADYTKGNRLLYQGHRVGMSRWRYFGNTLLTFLTRIGSGYWHLADPQNGYTAISAKVFKRFPPDAIFPWYGYCNDLLVKLNAYGFRVMDIPMPARYGREKSKAAAAKVFLEAAGEVSFSSIPPACSLLPDGNFADTPRASGLCERTLSLSYTWGASVY